MRYHHFTQVYQKSQSVYTAVPEIWCATDGWMDGRTDRQTDGWTDGRTDGWTDRPTDRPTDGWMDRQTGRKSDI